MTSRLRKQQREEESARGLGRGSLLRLLWLLSCGSRFSVITESTMPQLEDEAGLGASELRERQEGAIRAGNARAAARSRQAPSRARRREGSAELGLRRAPLHEELGRERGVREGRGGGLRHALLVAVRVLHVAAFRGEVEGGVGLRYDEVAEIVVVLRAVRPVLRVVEPRPGERSFSEPSAPPLRAAAPPPPRRSEPPAPQRM